MKLNSISGLTLNVQNLEESIRFYENLGMRIGKQDETHALCYVNWFFIDLVASDAVSPQNEGVATYIKVDSIDECYQGILAMDLKPQSEPEKKPSGNIEFTLSDPDGHNLVFFEKK